MLSLFALLLLAPTTSPASPPAEVAAGVPSVDAVMAGFADFYPALLAIEKAEPATYRRMRGIVEAGLAKGATGHYINLRMQAEISELYQRRLRTAPDELLLAYGDFMVAALEYLEKHDPGGCRALLVGGPAGTYGPELNRRDSDILARVVTAPAIEPKFASDEEASAASGRAVERAALELREPPERVTAALTGEGSAQQVCAAGRAFFAELRRIGSANPAVFRTAMFK